MLAHIRFYTAPFIALLLALTLSACLTEDDGEELAPPGHDVSGTWKGSWTSEEYPDLSGSVTVVLQADGNNITGTALFTGSECFLGSIPVTVTGTISGALIDLDVGNGNIRLEGATFDGFSLSGLYSVQKPAGCEDGGTVSLTKTAGRVVETDSPQGEWTGSWNSMVYPGFGGGLSLTLQQSGSSLSGSASFTGSDCFSGAMSVGGSTSGSSVSLSVGSNITFTGTVAGDSLNGSYSVSGPGDCEDGGTISLTKTAGTGDTGAPDTASWTRLNSGTTANLMTLYFTDTLTGYVAGAGGTIRKTTDGGLTWTALNSGSTAELLSIFFINATTGWVSGQGVVLKTENAGNTWTQQSEGDYTATSIHFVDANTGFAAAGDRLLATTNGGSTWTGTEASSSGYFGGTAFQKYHIRALYYTSATSGHVVGSATENRDGIVPSRAAIHRMPQGSSSVMGREDLGGSGLMSVHFPSQSTGYAVGSWGEIYKTTNSGGNWSSLGEDVQDQDGESLTHLSSVHFPHPDTGFVLSLRDGVVLHTTNGGSTWDIHDVGRYLQAVHCPATTTCYIAGETGVILKYH